MIHRVKALLLTLANWVRYLYFLRIPVLGWLMLPVLCLLDWKTGLSALTRGILVMSSGWQAFYSGFFVTCLGMTVLVCARNIVRNGKARFGVRPPDSLSKVFCGEPKRFAWIAISLAQLPAALTLLYIACITIWERAPKDDLALWKLWVCLAAGFFMTLVFWWLVTLFYLWTYLAGQEPVTLVFPGQVPFAAEARDASKPNFAWLAETVADAVFGLVSEGYRSRITHKLLELHFLSAVALSAFLLLYLMLYPLTAPVYFSRGIVDLIVAVCLFAFCVWGSRRENGGGWDRIALAFLSVTLVVLALFLVRLVPIARHGTIVGVRTFPTLASVLVILIFFQWLLSGATFFLDRYRAPVVTALLLLIFVPKLMLPIDQDHYFDAVPASYLQSIATPRQAVDLRKESDDAPYIVITATGGGIQAAAWTSEVMAAFEQSFQDSGITANGKPYTFHDHILLASGVSGGSVGLMPFLLEYTAAHPFQDDVKNLHARLTKPSACSSLEAVAWGLEYFDLQRLLLTWRPSLLSYRIGEYPNLSKPLPFTPDRTWALTRALNRNLSDNDPLCGTALDNGYLKRQSAEELTLRKAADLLSHRKMPAFTLNTTVAETGGRFLLSNYSVPRIPKDQARTTDFMPAESFLHVYQQQSGCDAASTDGKCYADIALATAARLSATFPVVSSATRIPRNYAKTASHFLDGGYYDNDGTASAAEFLYSAMDERARANREAAESGSPTPPYPKPLRILLVEIRDGNDLNPASNPDDWNYQVGKTVDAGKQAPSTWGIFHQILAPLDGLWNAGHASTTLRNRQQLCLLERAFAGLPQNALDVHHVVLGIPPAPVAGRPGKLATPPLSWKLTGRQIAYIREWVTGSEQPDDARRQTKQVIQGSVAWIRQAIAKDAAKPVIVSTVPANASMPANPEKPADSSCQLNAQILTADTN